MTMPTRRLAACVERWPDAETGSYDPSCCRFPKSCSATIYDQVDDADLEPAREDLPMNADPAPSDYDAGTVPAGGGVVPPAPQPGVDDPRLWEPDPRLWEPPPELPELPLPAEFGTLSVAAPMLEVIRRHLDKTVVIHLIGGMQVGGRIRELDEDDGIVTLLDGSGTYYVALHAIGVLSTKS